MYVCVCMGVRMCVCESVCACVHACVYVHVCVHTCTYVEAWVKFDCILIYSTTVLSLTFLIFNSQENDKKILNTEVCAIIRKS